MPNVLLTPQMITNELLLRFKNNLGFSGAIAHTWDDKFAISGAKIGDTLRLRDAVEFTVGKNPDITSAIQDVIETQKTLTLNQQAVVAFNFSSAELTLSIDAFSDRYLKSAAVALANQVDVDGLTMAYQSTGNQVGTPGTPIAALDPFWIAGETLDTFSAPMDGKRTMCISPKVQTAALKAAQGLFQSSNQVKQQYERGRMGTMGGFEWVMDQNVRTHTVGPLGGAPQVGAASQTGSTLAVTGFTAAAALRLRKGDSFTLPTVFPVNRVSSDPATDLQKFVVTADVSSAADGSASIPIYPPITLAPSPYQTVTNSPAAGAPLTITSGTAAQLVSESIAFHEAAFVIGMAPLEVPKGVHFAAAQMDPDTGVSIRMVSDYMVTTDKFITRCDVLYGHCAQRPEWAVRLVQ
jgi:hypothetical protein